MEKGREKKTKLEGGGGGERERERRGERESIYKDCSSGLVKPNNYFLLR